MQSVVHKTSRDNAPGFAAGLLSGCRVRLVSRASWSQTVTGDDACHVRK